MRKKYNIESEEILADQIPDFDSKISDDVLLSTPSASVNEASQYLGQQLTHKIGRPDTDTEGDRELAKRKNLSRIGDTIGENADIRDGWMEFDRNLLGDRNVFYPESWSFRIRPANVEAIRNWSTIDDENPISIDEVLNEMIKTCVSINNGERLIPWGNINLWDRFFFLLNIREYTFKDGESKIELDEECSECGNDVNFILSSQSLEWEIPDNDIMKYYDAEYRQWVIDGEEFGIEEEEPIVFYLPTLEKDSVIREYMINRIQNKKKIDNVFMRFLPWMSAKLPKDSKLAERKIRELENEFNSWDSDKFDFMDNVLTNIMVTPSQVLKSICPVCGEEVTTRVRFPDGLRSLFTIRHKFKKFGKK